MAEHGEHMRRGSGAIRVLVVDDSPYNRQTIKHILESDPGIQVIGVASNGRDAIGRIERFQPDVITLDIQMPVMDGFSLLRWLMANRPVPVIMVSSVADRDTVFRALEMGAVDFIPKPTRRATPELRGMETALLEKIRSLSGMSMDKVVNRQELLKAKPSAAAGGEVRPKTRRKYELIAIGASTGGPTALQAILTALPASLSAGIVISQHMPTGFTRPFAERMNTLCKLEVREVRGVDEIEPGTVLIAPGGSNLEVSRIEGRAYARSVAPGPEDKNIPNVNVMLRTAARTAGPGVVGVVLTGMGADGRDGMLEIKAHGGYTIAESEETSVVFGMPREVIAVGAAERVLPLYSIAEELQQLCTKGK